LIPDPLFPALAIRRRYLAFSHTRNVERPQTIKRESHSEEGGGRGERAQSQSQRQIWRAGKCEFRVCERGQRYLEASISTKLAGKPSTHLTQCATWPVLLRAGNRISEPSSDPAGEDDNERGVAIIKKRPKGKIQERSLCMGWPLADADYIYCTLRLLTAETVV
jgi:hypothetical protein